MAAMKQTELRGELRLSEAMSSHTSWRVGGPADQWYKPADLDDLQVFLQQMNPQESIYWVGLGSNLLVRDGGIRGTVILPFGGLNTQANIGGNTLRLGAGVSCAKAARFCARADLVGAEFLAGIPGTIGGALAMNAGAFGGEIWPLVESVEMINSNAVLTRHDAESFDVSYRTVTGYRDDEWFVSADLKLQSGDGQAALKRSKQLLEQRGKTQPVSEPSCGSVFRNPETDHAARLIESCGLKGERIGGAQVSRMHANFIVNRGSASANDIESLITYVQKAVASETGIQLKTEVKIIGER